MLKDILILSKKEIQENLFIILIQTLLFSYFFLHFSNKAFLAIVFPIFFFILFLHFSRILVMKGIAYHLGFELIPYQTKFTLWGFKNYQSVRSLSKKNMASTDFGIPSSLIVIGTFILSFGFLVIPSIYRFKTKKIAHKFIGTKYRFEDKWLHVSTVTDARIVKVLFSGYLYYFLFALFTTALLPKDSTLYIYYFIIFWTAGVSLLPIIGFEGFDLYIRNVFAYISAITINILGLFSLLIFNSLSSMFFSTIIISSIYLAVIYSKKFIFEK